MRCDDTGMPVGAVYAEFAAWETRGVSPTYERLSLAVSRDDEVLSLLGRLPPAKRQPNLLFGVVRFLGGPVGNPAAFHHFVVTNWPAVEAQMRTRATQTNEAGRCAILLPVLAALPQPLALLEVGASAGLCLYPDRYSYRYGDYQIGGGVPILDCAATGMVQPAGLPEVAARIRKALEFVTPDRLILAPDCGMKYLPRDKAFGKLSVLAQAAQQVRRELAGG